MQITKTYMGINPEMLHNEIRDLVQKQGIIAGEAKLETYPLPSGATQSRVSLVFKTQSKQKECGSAHIIKHLHPPRKLGFHPRLIRD